MVPFWYFFPCASLENKPAVRSQAAAQGGDVVRRVGEAGAVLGAQVGPGPPRPGEPRVKATFGPGSPLCRSAIPVLYFLELTAVSV